MDNNWIENGDAAFDTGEYPMGFLSLKGEEMANWHEIVLSRIKVARSERLLEFVKDKPYITIGALFSRRYGVTHKEFDLFVHDVVSLFDGCIPHLCSMDFGRSNKRNMISVNFSRMTLHDLIKAKDELRKSYR